MRTQGGIQQLEELGYIEPMGPDKAKNIERSLRENRYNLAVSYLDGQRYREAARLLTELWQEDPEAIRYLDRLIRVHVTLNELKKARRSWTWPCKSTTALHGSTSCKA